MPHDHSLLPDARKHQLLELRLRTIGDDFVIDAFFEGAGARTHLAFLGVQALKISGFTPGARGYAVVDVRDQKKLGVGVKLVPPKRKGVGFAARAVMSVD